MNTIRVFTLLLAVSFVFIFISIGLGGRLIAQHVEPARESQPWAGGAVPLPAGAGVITVRWRREDESSIAYSIDTPRPLRLHPGEAAAAPIEIESKAELRLVLRGPFWVPAGAPR